MTKFQRSWVLFKCSLRVLRENPKLFIFPLIALILTCIIALFFLVPIVSVLHQGHGVNGLFANYQAMVMDGGKHHHASPLIYLILAAIYVLTMFFATFFNVAFYNEIFHAFNGQPVSVRGGLKFALTRLKSILMWSLFTGAVGLVITWIADRLPLVGQWVINVIGIAWSVACIFVVPVIVREEKSANPVLFLKTSASVLKKTWGESLIGYVGIALFNWAYLWLSLVFFGVGIFLCYRAGNFWMLIVPGLLWLLLTILYAWFASIASQVFQCALFIYATEGVIPGPFEKDQMDMAWKIKSGRKALGI